MDDKKIKKFLEALEAVASTSKDTEFDIITFGSALFALKMEVVYIGEASWDKLSDYPFDTIDYHDLYRLLTIAGLTFSDSDGSVILKKNDN